MKRILLLTVALLMLAVTASGKNNRAQVVFRHDAVAKKVDVLVDGKYFTSYIYPSKMEKQVLYPIRTASGKEITRGYPDNPRPYERTDHPHHVGLWFNFGSVNGLDFWNNSFAIKPGELHKYGRIVFDKIVKADDKKGTLTVKADWVDSKENVLMEETTTFVFGGEGNMRTIERITRLKAATEVTLFENKEGLIAIRMDRAFEEPSTKPERFLDANGNVTDVPAMNNDGVNGVYRNAEGVRGGDVWAKKSKWVALRAEKEGEPVTVAIIDNRSNYGYPAWSHARGYGLFATNNLAGRAVDPDGPEVKVVIEPGKTLTFKHKIVITGEITDAELNAIADTYVK